jgi:predicted Zn-ribbon and HTH transcriptional regulator
MLIPMSHTYAHCRDCGRHKRDVPLSSRGRCPACALARSMAQAAAAVITITVAKELTDRAR